jgi:hypothetical protein
LWQLRKLARYIFDLEDQVDESLDLLDDRYKKLDSLTQIPVLMDEPVIRQMLQHMRDARESIAIISKKIRTFGEGEEEEQDGSET